MIGIILSTTSLVCVFMALILGKRSNESDKKRLNLIGMI